MKFIVNKEQLQNAITIVSRALPSKTTNPSLLCIKFNLNESLILTTYNGEISCEVKIDSKFIETTDNLVFLLDGDLISKIVAKLDAKDITFSKENNQMYVEADETVYKLNLQDIMDYPEIVINEIEKPIIIDSNDLRELIDSVNFACAQNEKRPIIAGTHFFYEEGYLFAEATDGYRLSKNKIKLPTVDNFSIVISSKSLSEIGKILLNYNCEVSISITDNSATFIFSNVKIETKLTEGVYPETQRLFPTNIDFDVILNKTELLKTVEKVILLSNKDKETNYNVIRMTLKNDQSIDFFSNNKDMGNANAAISCKNDVNGHSIVISFSSKHLLEAVKAITANEIKFQFVNNVKPFILKGNEDEKGLHLILPIRNI